MQYYNKLKGSTVQGMRAMDQQAEKLNGENSQSQD